MHLDPSKDKIIFLLKSMHRNCCTHFIVNDLAPLSHQIRAVTCSVIGGCLEEERPPDVQACFVGKNTREINISKPYRQKHSRSLVTDVGSDIWKQFPFGQKIVDVL